MTFRLFRAMTAAFVLFGQNASFFEYFGDAAITAIAGAAAVLSGVAVSASKTKRFAERLVWRLQPAAAVVFAAIYMLTFLPCSVMLPALFSTVVLNACVMTAFVESKGAGVRFWAAVCVCAVAGGTVGSFAPIGCGFVGFSLLSLLFRPRASEPTAQELWYDIAFPLFVLLCSFVSFMIAGHARDFHPVVAQVAALVMAGALPVCAKSSGVRLALMTLVVIVFGSYVFSVEDAGYSVRSTSVIEEVN